MSSAAISIHQLAFQYSGQPNPVFNGLNLEVAAGLRFGLFHLDANARDLAKTDRVDLVRRDIERRVLLDEKRIGPLAVRPLPGAGL